MGNTLIGLTNRIEAGTLLNGTGGAPALEQASPYVMTNAGNSDRYSLWKTSAAPPATTQIDFDLGGNKTIAAVGLLGIRLAAGTTFGNIKVYTASSAAGYPGGLTLQATLAVSVVAPAARDYGAVIASVSHRYVRFEFNTTTGPFSVGRCWAGAPTDLGAVHGPGGIYAPFRNRLETPMPSGAVVLADLGDPGADFTLPWPTVQSALRTTLLTLQGAAGSFLLVDTDGNFFEVFAKGGRVQTQRDFSTLFSANIELSRMP
jgi:hypothetical protein